MVTNTIAISRKAAGITQVDLSFRSGIERKRLGEIERHERECDLADALAISAGLGCSANDLFTRSAEPSYCPYDSRKRMVINLTGMPFGHLTVKHRIVGTHRHKKEAFWLCRCDCGNETIVRSDHLRSGHTKSCGCKVRGNYLVSGRNSVRL